MVGKTKHKTKADEQRMDVITEIGCIICLTQGRDFVPCTVHHITDTGHRVEDEHQNTVGLCPWHHQGEIPGIYKGSISLTTRKHGPSLEHDARAFTERYGNQEELVLMQNALIRVWEGETKKGGYLSGRELVRLARLLHLEIVGGQLPKLNQIHKMNRPSRAGIRRQPGD